MLERSNLKITKYMGFCQQALRQQSSQSEVQIMVFKAQFAVAVPRVKYETMS